MPCAWNIHSQHLSILNNMHNMTMLCAGHTVRWYLKKIGDPLFKIKSIIFVQFKFFIYIGNHGQIINNKISWNLIFIYSF